MVPPGIPDFYHRTRVAAPGRIEIRGRAWSGSGAVTRVEFAADGEWSDARLDAPAGEHAWRGWSAGWNASPGEHELRCRATDGSGETQPLEPQWDATGFGNNAAQRVAVKVQ